MREDYRTASIVCMLANVNRDSKKHPEPFKIEDFLLKFETVEKKPLTPEQQIALFKAITTAFTGAGVDA